jgi:hypothetical protein
MPLCEDHRRHLDVVLLLVVEEVVVPLLPLLLPSCHAWRQSADAQLASQQRLAHPHRQLIALWADHEFKLWSQVDYKDTCWIILPPQIVRVKCIQSLNKLCSSTSGYLNCGSG